MEEITSVNNQYIKWVNSLYNKDERINNKRFLIEGTHLILEAFSHHALEKVLFTREYYQNNEAILNKITVPSILVSEAVMKKISKTATPPGIIGICIMEEDDASLIIKSPLRLLILDGLNDPGNMGTLIRTAAALGYDGVVASNDSVDYYNDKTIRATQGAIFKIPLIKENLNTFLPRLKQNKITIFATTLKNAIPLNEVKIPKSFAIIVGNEAKGIKEETIMLADQNIIIPMQNNVESLNASIAGSIIMYYMVGKN